MRAQTTLTFLACWTATGLSPTTAAAHSRDTPALAALQFFESLPAPNVAAALHALRPPQISEAERTRVVSVLPETGELQPDRAERAKLAMLEPVMVYHERAHAFEIKLIDVPQAFVGLHQRAVLLLSRPAVRLLSGVELQALVAHEIGHEYFWTEFERTLAQKEGRGRQELELKCDGIAVLTLIALGLDPACLADGLRKMTRFNETAGATADADDYPRPHERERFIKALRALPFVAH